MSLNQDIVFCMNTISLTRMYFFIIIQEVAIHLHSVQVYAASNKCFIINSISISFF